MNSNLLQDILDLILKIGGKLMKNTAKDPALDFWKKMVFSLSLYNIGIEKICTIDDEDINFVNKYGCDLIGNP